MAAKWNHAMILMAETVWAWGNISTFHFTFPSRSAIMQTCLSQRFDFTESSDDFFRGAVWFTKYIAGSVVFENPSPVIRADNLTEVEGIVVADNCGTVGIVSQFSTTPSLAIEAGKDEVDFKMVALFEPNTGNISHTHIVKAFKGGRAISEQEAIDMAKAHARRAGRDVAQLRAKVSKNVEHADRPQRIDVQKDEIVAMSVPLFDFGPPI